MDAIKLMDAKFSLLLIRRSLVRVQQGEPKKADTQSGICFFSSLDAPASRTCGSSLRCSPTERSEGGRERPDRRRGREKGGERVAAVGR